MGRRRNSSDNTDFNVAASNYLTSGFTAHEHLPWFNLVNMNGRMYDPVVGRFLNVDPFVQMPDYTQSYNRYSYCLNNPLRYTDPSGNKWNWNWLNPVYWLGEAMQKLNDNSEGLRKELAKAGIPDINVGVTVNGAGNVNANGSIMGREVINTANKDRSNAEQVVNKEINQVRQDYWQAWHATSEGGINAEFYTKTGLGASFNYKLMGYQLGIGGDIISKKRTIAYDGSNVKESNSKVSSFYVSFLLAGGSVEYDYTAREFSGELTLGTMVFGSNGYSTRIVSGDFGIFGQVGGKFDIYPIYLRSNYSSPVCPIDNTRVVIPQMIIKY